MTRFALFASAIAVFCTINCSEDPVDNNPPVVNELSKSMYSVYDTITISFNEDLLALTSANYTATPELNCSLDSIKPSQIKCIGTSNGTAGIPQLASNTSYQIALTGLTDGHNNVAADTTLTAQTMTWVDLDFNDGQTPANDNVASSVFLNTYDGTAITDTLINGKIFSEGIYLSGFLGATALNYDTQDYYSMGLKARDSLIINVSGITHNILVRVYGSSNLDSVPDATPAIEKEFTPGSNQSLTYYVDANDYFTMENVLFWVRVSIIDSRQDAFSLYTLNIEKITP